MPETQAQTDNQETAGTTEFNPEAILSGLQAVAVKLDALTSGPEARDLHDLVQDELLPGVIALAKQAVGIIEFLHIHNERIADLEEETGSQLLPEDAAKILGWMKRASRIMVKSPERTALLEEMQEIAAMIEAITLDAIPEGSDDEEEDGEPDAG